MTLQVAFNNQIISNSVVFEYKARALPTLPSSQHDWLSLDGKKHETFFNKAHDRAVSERSGSWCGGGMQRGKFVLWGRSVAHLIKDLVLKFLISSFDVKKTWLHLMGRRQRGGFFV